MSRTSGSNPSGIIRRGPWRQCRPVRPQLSQFTELPQLCDRPPARHLSVRWLSCLRARFHPHQRRFQPHQRGRVAHAMPWTWHRRRGNRQLATLAHQASRAKTSRLPDQQNTAQLGRKKDVTVAVAAPDGIVITPAGSEPGFGQGGPHQRTMITALATRRLAPRGGPHPRTMGRTMWSRISFYITTKKNNKLGPFALISANGTYPRTPARGTSWPWL